MSDAQPRFGGSFAPPIDADTVDRYRVLAEAAGNEMIAGYMRDLCRMVATFQETPKSRKAPKPHPSGVGQIVKLEAAEVDRIFDVVPWPAECDLIGQAFDKLHPVHQRDVRNAAFHLLWYARELAQDREPITTDTL